MRIRVRAVALMLLVACCACGGNPADVEDIKKGQKEILDRLATLEKSVQDVKKTAAAAAPAATPARPQIDPAKVYNIPLKNSPMRGPSCPRTSALSGCSSWTPCPATHWARSSAPNWPPGPGPTCEEPTGFSTVRSGRRHAGDRCQPL